jgi:hypothetical protein
MVAWRLARLNYAQTLALTLLLLALRFTTLLIQLRRLQTCAQRRKLQLMPLGGAETNVA